MYNSTYFKVGVIEMPVNYNEISQIYDNVRSEEKSIIDLFLEEIKPTAQTRILDFGCGTGNYASVLSKCSNAEVYGVEPSDGMREKAKAKESNAVFVKGSHAYIPFEGDYFDFIYMTDVIHHVPNIGIMFNELARVLKVGGKICIVTESHKQIENRCFVKYFPSTALVDKERYPDIDEIINEAIAHSLGHIKNTIRDENRETLITSDFLELVRNKGYSMFHLIPNDEYLQGLNQLEQDLLSGPIKCISSGETLIWLKK